MDQMHDVTDINFLNSEKTSANKQMELDVFAVCDKNFKIQWYCYQAYLSGYKEALIIHVLLALISTHG